MKYKNLSTGERESIRAAFEEASFGENSSIETELALKFDVSTRTIQNWKVKVGASAIERPEKDVKVLIYDIETSRATVKTFWTGKQFIGYRQVIKDPSIISISYKWLGEDEVYSLVWDKDRDDKRMVSLFLEAYNKADLVIGYNNNNFDNRWVVAQAIRHNLQVNNFVKSLDLMKEEKRIARLISYSMDYGAKMMKLELKKTHEGMVMWDMIEDGTPEQQKEYLDKMVEYNIGDIITTEQIYLYLLKYMKHQTHLGVLTGKEKYSCPNCGGYHVEHFKTVTTAAGTPQIIMICKDDQTQYKINNSQFNKFQLNNKSND